MNQALQISKHGGPDVLQLVDQSSSSSSLEAGNVRIRVKAAGVNFADLMMRMGTYPEAPRPPFTPGYEVSGVVEEVGSSVESLKVGDRVFGGTRFGGYVSQITLPAFQVRKTPAHMSDVEAAAILVNFLTAWVALNDMVRIRKGDRVLIQSAAGGVGIAAIQMVKNAGATAVGLIGSPQKENAIRDLGIDEVILNDDWNSASDTKYEKFDAILDSTGGESLKRSYRRLRTGGRVVNFGAANMVSGEKKSLFSVLRFLRNTAIFTPFQLMMANKGVFGLNMLQLFEPESDPKNSLMERALDQVTHEFEQKRLKVVIGKTFPLAEGANAHRYLQSRSNIGKVVLTM